MSSSAPALFDAMVQAATRIAIGSNNTKSIPARGRLAQLFNLYSDENHSLDKTAFVKLLACEFRGIPGQAHEALFRYCTKHTNKISVQQLVNLLIPPGFSKERSVLDFPCTFHNESKSQESLSQATENIRLEMMQHVRQKNCSLRDYFRMIDADGSGTLDIGELIASLRHDNIAIGRYHACKALVRRFDRSKKGRLTFNDFERMLQLETPGSKLKLAKMAGGRRPGPTRIVQIGMVRRKPQADRMKARLRRKTRAAGVRRTTPSLYPRKRSNFSALPSPFNQNFEMHQSAWSSDYGRRGGRQR